MVSAYRRAVNASSAQHVEAKLDPDTGRVTIFAEKEVVEDIMDDRTEVLLEVARKYHGYYFAWAIIYTFWYHPMEITGGHLLGFFYMFLLLLHTLQQGM